MPGGGDRRGALGWWRLVDPRSIEARKGGSSVAQPVLNVAIHGATGRMGTRLIQLIQADPALRLVAAIDRGDHPRLGEDAGTLCGVGPLGVPLAATLEGPA